MSEGKWCRSVFFPQMVTIAWGNLSVGGRFQAMTWLEMATQWLEQAGCGHHGPKPGQEGDMAPKATSSV